MKLLLQFITSSHMRKGSHGLSVLIMRFLSAMRRLSVNPLAGVCFTKLYVMPRSNCKQFAWKRRSCWFTGWWGSTLYERRTMSARMVGGRMFVPPFSCVI